MKKIRKGQENQGNAIIVVGKLRRPNQKQKSKPDLNQRQTEFDEGIGIAGILTHLGPEIRKRRGEKENKSGIEGLRLSRGNGQESFIGQLRIAFGEEIHRRARLLEQGPENDRTGY